MHKVSIQSTDIINSNLQNQIQSYRYQIQIHTAPISNQMESFRINKEDQPESFQEQPCFGVQKVECEFKRSQYPKCNNDGDSKTQKINLKDFYLQQKINILRLQLKLKSISNLYELKLLNTKRTAFQFIKNTPNPQQLIYKEKCLVTYKLNEIFIKIANFVQKRRIKLISKSFTNIFLTNLPSYGQENQKCIKKFSQKRTSQLARMKSQIQENVLQAAQGLGSSNMTTNSVKLKNKELKKQKRNFDKNLNDFYSQMDQILLVHENYIKKK